MKKELLVQFSFLLTFFLLVSFVQGWLTFRLVFPPEYLAFWAGGLVGSLLPYLDHLICIYLLRPDDAMSKKAVEMIEQKKLSGSLEMLTSERVKQDGLIFHTAYFQILFTVFSFFVITSTNGYLGRGIVLAFLLHLLIKQLIDFTENKNIHNWFRGVVVSVDVKAQRWYILANFLVLLFLALYF